MPGAFSVAVDRVDRLVVVDGGPLAPRSSVMGQPLI